MVAVNADHMAKKTRSPARPLNFSRTPSNVWSLRYAWAESTYRLPLVPRQTRFPCRARQTALKFCGLIPLHWTTGKRRLPTLYLEITAGYYPLENASTFRTAALKLRAWWTPVLPFPSLRNGSSPSLFRNKLSSYKQLTAHLLPFTALKSYPWTSDYAFRHHRRPDRYFRRRRTHLSWPDNWFSRSASSRYQNVLIHELYTRPCSGLRKPSTGVF